MILDVEYEDGTIQKFSRLMYEQVASEKSCDATALRDLRVKHVVSTLLAVVREYGLQVGDTPYLSVLFNQSLNNNIEEATKQLWAEWIGSKPLSLDDVDLLTVDRVLTSQKKTLGDVLKNQGESGV